MKPSGGQGTKILKMSFLGAFGGQGTKMFQTLSFLGTCVLSYGYIQTRNVHRDRERERERVRERERESKRERKRERKRDTKGEGRNNKKGEINRKRRTEKYKSGKKLIYVNQK